jgi:hypothetical protein
MFTDEHDKCIPNLSEQDKQNLKGVLTYEEMLNCLKRW